MEEAFVVVKLSYRPGSDGVPLFRFGKPDSALLLLDLLIVPMTAGVFPLQWKITTTVPPHENGTLNELQTHPPINQNINLGQAHGGDFQGPAN